MHAVGEVPGLYLQVFDTGARSWVLRVNVAGRRREMGLGGFPAVTIADARARARDLREKADEGIDPIEQRKAARSALKAAQIAAVTFEKCAGLYISAHESSWRNAKHGQQWKNTLETYAYPVLGSLLVRDVGKEHVLQVLQPIWNEKTETASRVRSRIELVLSYAMQAGYRPEGLNPARWKGGLDKLLAAPTKVSKVQHHEAIAVGDIGEFMTMLRQAEGMGALALEFAILTAARSGEVRGATLAEIDRKGRVWTVPAGRMKGEREHRVPLTDAALAVIDKAAALADANPNRLLFPARSGNTLSDMTLTAVLRRMKLNATAHGFRSTFRDWAAERTNYPNEMAEMALAHAVGDKVEAAYRRGDMFEKRRHMMAAWAAFIARPDESADVVPIGSKRKRGAAATAAGG